METEKEKKLKDERMAEYKKKAEEQADKYNKKSKDTKKEPPKVEEKKEVLVQKVLHTEKAEIQPLDDEKRKKLLKIHIGILDDPKSIDIMF